MKFIKTRNEFLNEAVRVETNRYERSHGKKPRGYGQWAFYFDDRGGDPIFTPKAMSYSDAVKWAKGEAKKAGKEYIYVGESLDEKRSTPYGEIMLDLDAAMKKAMKKGVTTLSYAKDYIQSLERMAKKNAKQFFKDYGDFTEDDWIEDVRYNMANEKVNESKGDKAVSMAQKKLDKVMSDLKANLVKFKGAKTDKDKETFKSEASRLTQLRKDAQAELDDAIQSAYADAELVIMENYDTEQRKEMAAKGLALPDGSFPIKTLEDLKNAIQAYGRAKDQGAAAKFIAKRAKALSAEDLIPDTEDFQKALKEAEFGKIQKFGK